MGVRRTHFSLLICLLVFCFAPVSASAKEVIHSYHSKIKILPDGGLHVTETIDVKAEGKKIRRGIFRDFPLSRRTFLGGILHSDYIIESVKRDGQDEPHHTQKKEDGGYLRLYIGKRNVFLDPRRYVYEIQYSIPKQVFFFNDYDELYWNAIGTGWEFPILNGRVEVVLPSRAPILHYNGYTGKALSKAQNFTAEPYYNNSLRFETTKPLAPYEGMTVAVSWPKGFITPPPDMVGLAFFWKQHPGLHIVLLGLLFLSVYYFYVWRWFGVDPKSRGKAPFYSPPEGISPAMAAVIHSMGKADSTKCMATALISLAAKGYITIHEKSTHRYDIKRSDKPVGEPPISEDELILFNAIKNDLSISKSSESLIKPAAKHREKLTEICHKIYFFKNTKWWFGGILIAILTVIAYGMQTHAAAEFWIGLLFVLVFGVVSMAAIIYSIKEIFTAPPAKKAGSVFFLIWGIGFSIGGWMGLYLLLQNISWLVLPVMIAMIIIIVKMRHIMKAPTLKGRDVIDHLNGLKYYMEAVEEKILKTFDPPEMSRELYETYLPYAVALGVESKWGDKFSMSVAGAGLAVGAAIVTAPSWYSSSSSASGGHGFSSQSLINNFSTTLAAASTSNASSGSGGYSGGSSGGGGGGGGGGGW